MKPVLVVGLSARAAAESAGRAGFDVIALDAFGDRDQHPSVRSIVVPGHAGRFSARAAADAAHQIDCDAVVYLSNFENHPAAVAALSRGRALWGNSPDVLRCVRNPVVLADALRRRGFAAPEVRLRPAPSSSSSTWLIKPLRSGGGLGIRQWDSAVPSGHYLQEHIPGFPASIVFIATAARAVPLGFSRQLAGDEAFGASGKYQYCGNILTLSEDAGLVRQASAIADAVTTEFGLVGVNGIDFVVHGGQLYPVEVNPRWCASMELVERACGVSVFAAHAAACRDAALPDSEPCAAGHAAESVGKAIVFARRDGRAPDTDAWLQDPDIRDVPNTGARIARGAPVCTVFASGTDAAACHASLVERAARIYRSL